jgi:glutamate synthase (NADPH/NADH)
MSKDSWEYPAKDGLYDPGQEKEACGVGFIVAIDGALSHKVPYFLHTSSFPSV